VQTRLAIFFAGLIGLAIVLALSLAVGIRNIHRPRELYHLHFATPRRERQFLASLAFFLSFAIVRILTHAIHSGRGPFHDISMGGRHIHHLVWGILLLLAVGYGWLLEVDAGDGVRSRWLSRIMSLLYGVGAAITLDEFALWLNLRDVYWDREGRASVDATLLFGALLSMGIWGAPFFHGLAKEASRLHFPHQK
jgi:hypothetical protein